MGLICLWSMQPLLVSTNRKQLCVLKRKLRTLLMVSASSRANHCQESSVRIRTSDLEMQSFLLTGIQCSNTHPIPVPTFCHIFPPKAGPCWFSTYLVYKGVWQGYEWSWVGCKNERCCVFSHDEQLSISKGHESIYGRQSSGTLVFSGKGWERLF